MCSVHRLMRYTKEEAWLDAVRLREEAEPGTPNSVARAEGCKESGSWHIFVPTKGRMRTLRKRARSRDEKET